MLHASVGDIDEITNGFRVHYDHNKTLTLVSANADDKALWMKEITNAIAGQVSRSSSFVENDAASSAAAGASPAAVAAVTAAAAAAPNAAVPLPPKAATATRSRSGLINRLEGSIVKLWRQRWVVVVDGTLLCYRNRTDLAPQSTHQLNWSNTPSKSRTPPKRHRASSNCCPRTARRTSLCQCRATSTTSGWTFCVSSRVLGR